MRGALVFLLSCLPSVAFAAERLVPAEPGTLQRAIHNAEVGDVLRLAAGRHEGPVTIDRPLTVDGQGTAQIDAGGKSSVVTIAAPDVVVRGLVLSGSGSSHETIDSGVKLGKKAVRSLVTGNRLIGNLYGVDIHGALDARVAGNVIVGRSDFRVNDRGNGVYVWNAPGAVVENNDISMGRDGIFSNSSKRNVFRNNRFRDLRFAVHYMYTNDSEVIGNVSIGNDLGFAIMYSSGIRVIGNRSEGDKRLGLLLNYANSSVIRENHVTGGAEKCVFIYNANKNEISDNRFEGCGIGIHFTAGSERNAITGNAFVGNRTQVKYVGTRLVEWSLNGRGNFWSDNFNVDLNGDGIGDSPYRPNDVVDQIVWRHPAAKILLSSPAFQVLRWAQSAFPGLYPGGVRDSAPLMTPPPLRTSGG
jgi:nitrous oxidase accessory protein